MKKLLTVVALYSALIFGFAAPSVLMAAVNELSTSIILSADPMPDGVPVLNVLPSTTYTHTISVTNNLASKAPIVKIVLRLPDPFVMVDPVVCPPNWTEVSTQNNGRGVGMINCVENGLDTSIPNPTSNPQYDLAYGQTTSVSYSFTTPSVNGTTELFFQVFYINSSGLMQGTGFGGSYAPAQIVVGPAVVAPVLPPTCTSWTYSDWSSCSSSGTQTRSVVSSSPNSCTGGSPIVSQSCIYVPPTVACTVNDWVCSGWNSCPASGSQTRACNKISDCQGGVVSPAISQNCTPVLQQATSTSQVTPPVPLVVPAYPIDLHQDLVRTTEDLKNQAVTLEEKPVTSSDIKAPKTNDKSIIVASLSNDGASLERDIAKLNAQIKKIPEIKNAQNETKENVSTTIESELKDKSVQDNNVATSTESVRSKSLWVRIMRWFGF